MTYPPGQQPQYGGYPQQPNGYPPQQGYPQQQPPGGYPGYPGYPPPQPPRKKNTALIVSLAGLAVAAIVAVVLVITLSGKDDSSSADSGLGTGGKPSVNIPGPNGGGGGGLPSKGSVPSGGGRPSGSGGVSGTSTGSKELAEKAVDIINSHATSEIAPLSCDANATKELTQAMGTLPSGSVASLSSFSEQGSYAVGAIKVVANGKSQLVMLKMSKHGSDWCAAGL